MNEQTSKFASVLFTLMLVVGMTVSFAGFAAADAAANDDPVELNNYERYWMGQTLEYTNDDADIENAELYEDDSFVTELSVDEETVEIDTADLNASADYELQYEDGDGSDDESPVGFEVSEQDLDVEFEDMQVLNDGDDTETSVEYDSNRVDFAVNVSADGLDNDDLDDIFGEDDVAEDDTIAVDADDLGTVDFDGIDDGEYEFEFEVVDADAEDNATVTVSEPGDAQAEFSSNSFESVEGDTGELEVELEETDTATVTFGDEDDMGYEIVFEVEDGSDSDNVTVDFNAHEAGHGTYDGDDDDASNIDESDTVTAVDSDDSVTVLEETSIPDDFRLYPDTYDLSVSVDEGGEDRETDLAYFHIQDRVSEDATSHVLPGSDSIDEYDDVVNATESSSVAEGDHLALSFELNGIYGTFDAEDVEDASDLKEDSDFADEHGIYLDIEEVESGPNFDPSEVDLDYADLYVDEDDEQVFVVFEDVYDDNDAEFEVENEYDVDLVLNESNAYIDDEDDEEVLSLTFDTVDLETEFVGLNDDDELEFEEGDEFEVVAETTAAEGTEDTYTFRMTSGDAPSISSEDVEVEDGYYTSTINGSDLAEGDEFEVELRGADIDADAVVVAEEDPEPETYDVDVYVEDEDGAAVDADISLNGEDADGSSATFTVEDGEYTASAEADGYYAAEEDVEVDGDNESVTLELEEEAEPEEHTLTVDVIDEDGDALEADVTVDGETQTGDSVDFELEDGEYTVTADADGFDEADTTVTVDGEDADTTLSLEEEESDDGDDDADDVPGFGVVVALLAIVAAALGAAYVRREE